MVNGVVVARGWLILHNNLGVFSMEKLSATHQALVNSIHEARLRSNSGLVDVLDVIKEFKENNVDEKLFHNMSVYRFLLCYCGLSLALINCEGTVVVRACISGDANTTWSCFLSLLCTVGERESQQVVWAGMKFLESCVVCAINDGAPVQYVTRRQNYLALAVCRGSDFVLGGLDRADVRWEFKLMWSGFLKAFGDDNTSSAIETFCSKFFTPQHGGGRPTMVEMHPTFLVALENVVQECGSKTDARLQEVEYAAGANASARIYREKLLSVWGIDVAPATILTYLAPRKKGFRAAQRHSPLHLMFRPVKQKKDCESDHVDVHYCRADVKGVLSVAQSSSYRMGTICCSSDVKSTIYTSNSRVALTSALTTSWSRVVNGQAESMQLNAHDFDKSKGTSLCANGFLFLDAEGGTSPGFCRRGQGVYTVRNIGVLPNKTCQLLSDLLFGLEVIAQDGLGLQRILHGENTFCRWVEVTDSGPGVAPSKKGTQIALAFLFCCFSLDTLIRVTYAAGDSKMNPVERLHAALSRVFGMPIERGDGDEGLFKSGEALSYQMSNPGFTFAGGTVKASAWTRADVGTFLPAPLVEFIESGAGGVDTEEPLLLPPRLLAVIAMFQRPAPSAITVSRLLCLLERGHGGSTPTRCTITRCGVEGCNICGGVFERVPLPLTRDRQFPGPKADPSNELHYKQWFELSQFDPDDVLLDCRPSVLLGACVEGAGFHVGSLRALLDVSSVLFENLVMSCRVSNSREKQILLDEVKKQVDKLLRKRALLMTSVVSCGNCRQRVCVLDAASCDTCKSNVCAVCWDVHHGQRGHVCVPPRLVSSDLSWGDIAETGLVNNVAVTKAMLEARLRDIGKWEASFRYLKKDALMAKVKASL